MAETDEHRIALHEATHCVVGLLSGADITSVSLDPGITSYVARALPSLAVSLAPIAAQVVFGADVLVGDDLESARGLEAQLDCIDVDAYVRRLLKVLQAMIAEHEEVIERVARELVRRGKLTGDEVRQIVFGERQHA